MAIQTDLASLLFNALAAVDRLHAEQGAGRGALPSLEQWANMMRVLEDGALDRRELPRLLRLSTRAVRSGVAAAARTGWVEDIGTGRDQQIGLTSRGRAAANRWPGLRAAAEERWATGVGADRAEALRKALEAFVGQLPLELPHYPAGYGPADASITGGHGRDWSAVERERGDTVSWLPVSALLSQTLVACAMSYEDKMGVALSLSAKVLRRIPEAGLPAAGLAPPGGLSALERHGYLSSSPGGGGARRTVVRLTAKGRRIRDSYEDQMRAVEAEWGETYGPDMAALRGALEAAASARGPG